MLNGFAKIVLALGLLMAPISAFAADTAPTRVVRAPAPGAIVIEQASPLEPPPVIRYGCSRVWRCDSVVCEWRRGCWGTYGYMEGPYYSLSLAKRQWERHGWPTPPQRATP